MGDQVELKGLVNDESLRSESQGVWAGLKINRRGELVVMDWYTQMALEGRIYQVRAGNLTTPIVGDAVITTVAADMAASAPTGITMIPCQLDISVRLAVNVDQEYAAKSVADTAHSGGTAFIPLPLYLGGKAATCTAATAATGGVTVAADATTTTRRHWSYSNPIGAAAGHSPKTLRWVPKTPPVLPGVSCFYINMAADTAGPSYYASFDFVELPTVNVG